jgi:hypothetical protein
MPEHPGRAEPVPARTDHPVENSGYVAPRQIEGASDAVAIARRHQPEHDWQ